MSDGRQLKLFDNGVFHDFQRAFEAASGTQFGVLKCLDCARFRAGYCEHYRAPVPPEAWRDGCADGFEDWLPF